MAHSLSARKRIRQNEKRRQRTRSHRSKLRTQVKRFRQAVESQNEEEARKLMPETASLIDQMVNKGIVHRNAAARYKSRLASKLNRSASSPE